MTSPAPTPRHSMMRLGKGDYLLLSDDSRDLYRLLAYDETGDLEGGETGRPIVGRFWRTLRLVQDVPDVVPDGIEVGRIVGRNPDGTIDWINVALILAGTGSFDEWSSLHRTRREAAEEVAR